MTWKAICARTTPEVVVLSGREGALHGHHGVRRNASHPRCYDPRASYVYDQVLTAQEFAMLQWHVDGDDVDIHDGADSFVVRDGRIIAQAIHYTVRDKH